MRPAALFLALALTFYPFAGLAQQAQPEAPAAAEEPSASAEAESSAPAEDSAGAQAETPTEPEPATAESPPTAKPEPATAESQPAAEPEPATAEGAQPEAGSAQAAQATAPTEPGGAPPEIAVPPATAPTQGAIPPATAGGAAAGEGAPQLEAALGLTSAPGVLTDEERSGILEQARQELGNKYKLVPQERYGRAESRAIEQLGVEQCSTEACLKRAKTNLLADRLFALGITQEEDVTRISLRLLRNRDKIVRTDTCQACGVEEIQSRVRRMIAEVSETDLSQEPDLKAVAESLPTPEPEEPQKVEGKSFFAKLPWWVYIAGGALVLGLLAGGGGGGDDGGGGGGSSSGSAAVSW